MSAPNGVIVMTPTKVYVGGQLQPQPTSCRITRGLDQISTSATIEFATPLVGGASVDFMSPVQIIEDGQSVFAGVMNAGSKSRSPGYAAHVEAYDWLGVLQNMQLDLEGFVFGASPVYDGQVPTEDTINLNTLTGDGYDVNGNPLPDQEVIAIGFRVEDGIYRTLQLGGIPSASIGIDTYTGTQGPSSAFLLGSVVPFYATQTGYWDIVSEMTLYNGYTIYCDKQGVVRWKYFSAVPTASPAFTFYEGDPGASGYHGLDYTRDDQYTYNRVELTGVDASGVYNSKNSKCSQIAAIASAESVKGRNGLHIVPDNPLNTEVDPVSGSQYLGYRALMIQSNVIDTPEMARNVVLRILAEMNTIYENLQIECLPLPFLNLGDTIHVVGETTIGDAAGAWVVREIVDDKSNKGHLYTIQCNRGSFGDARHGAGI